MQNPIAALRRRNLAMLLTEQFGGSHTAFKNRTGISLSQTGQWLSGERNMGESSARKIEAKCGLSDGALDQPEIDTLAEPKPSEERLSIPRFDTGGKMGDGLELRDQPGIIESLKVSPEWLQKNVKSYSAATNLAIVTGFGDSMQPMYNPGDPLIIDVGIVTVEFDAVYFFRVGQEGFIKRLQRIPTDRGMILRAKSENKEYDSWDISPGMDFEVFGRVLKVWCSRDF
ncbi:S24 family peptidase [Bordetella hinzii]|uniref:S24 family peptidase n=1 Tax=Bordetella hinzii TaxID=103855 RepID=UPI00114E38F0|nr:S24 family peptidase [Bordetella hinzii]QDJ40311.1 hypothetical protein CBR70_02880 [Bordetella hinzii]